MEDAFYSSACRIFHSQLGFGDPEVVVANWCCESERVPSYVQLCAV